MVAVARPSVQPGVIIGPDARQTRQPALAAPRATFAEITSAGTASARITRAVASLRRAPVSDLVDAAWYRAANPDVAKAGIDPATHYRRHGAAEGRWPNPWVDPRFLVQDRTPGHANAKILAEAARRHAGATSAFFCGGRLGAPTAPGGRLVSLDAFRRALAAGETVGHLDVCTRDVVAGWLAPSPGCTPGLVEVRVNGELVGRCATTLPRPDMVARCGRHCGGFLLRFGTPLRDDDLLEVTAVDGRNLVGSPFAFLSARPPQIAGDEATFCVERAAEKALPRGPVRLAGWASLPAFARDLRILVDGEAVAVSFFDRWDLRNRSSVSPAVLGWEVALDLSAAARSKRVLDFDVEIDGRSAYRRTMGVRAPRPHPSRPLVLFMHIPKTAGTSLTRSIDAIEDRHSFWLYDRPDASIDEQMAGLTPRANLLDGIDVVGGHFAFGLHDRIGRACRYVSVLRDPLDWLQSYFFYCRDVRRDPRFTSRGIVDAVAARLDPMFDNPFTRFFSGRLEGQIDAGALGCAMANMDRHFAFVGLVERMEDSVTRIGALLQRPLATLRENGRPADIMARRDHLSRLEAVAEPGLRLDRRLYRHAVERFWSDS